MEGAVLEVVKNFKKKGQPFFYDFPPFYLKKASDVF